MSKLAAAIARRPRTVVAVIIALIVALGLVVAILIAPLLRPESIPVAQDDTDTGQPSPSVSVAPVTAEPTPPAAFNDGLGSNEEPHSPGTVTQYPKAPGVGGGDDTSPVAQEAIDQGASYLRETMPCNAKTNSTGDKTRSVMDGLDIAAKWHAPEAAALCADWLDNNPAYTNTEYRITDVSYVDRWGATGNYDILRYTVTYDQDVWFIGEAGQAAKATRTAQQTAMYVEVTHQLFNGMYEVYTAIPQSKMGF